MTEKRYSLLHGIDENPYEWDIIDNEKNSIIYQSNGIAICNELNELNDKCEFLKIENESLEDGATRYAELYHKSLKENEQLKQQIKIFEKFLEGNDLSIDWDEFCGVVECAFENPDFSCKECIHLKGDVE